MESLAQSVTNPAILPEPPQLIVGIGNSGRSDDGLGWAFLDELEKLGAFEGLLVYRYQLQVEDAEMISRYDSVLFVDATYTELNNGFQLVHVVPDIERSFSTHALEPATVLGLCMEIYGKRPDTRLLMIEGECWDLNNGLSNKASQNLSNALSAFNTLDS